MRVSSKGQVTIPRRIREQHGLGPATEVRFVEDGDRVYLEREASGLSRGERMVEAFRNSATDKSMTTDEIMALFRGED